MGGGSAMDSGSSRHGFRVKPGMVVEGGSAMDSGSSPEWWWGVVAPWIPGQARNGGGGW